MSTWARCACCGKDQPVATFVDATVGRAKCICGESREVDEFERRFVLDQAAEALHTVCKAMAARAESHSFDRREWDRIASLFAEVS